jgi:Nucleotidyl transferase AbiEii toxin, Type IV TA system
MTAPDWLRELLGEDTSTAWRRMAPLVPAGAYLGGGTAIAARLRHRSSRDLDFFFHGDTVDLDELAQRLGAAGPFAIARRTPGTLNGVFNAIPVQFLQAGLTRPERRLEPAASIEGLEVAGLGDLLAMKLNAVAGRAQLRDYFDLMSIEQLAGRSVEEGLSLFLTRYQPVNDDSAIAPILLALAYLDDVGDDPALPMNRADIAQYWSKRQPQIVASIERHGLSRLPEAGEA